MASKRLNPSSFLVGLIKLISGVAIALFVISLAGVATARYFLTQLSSLPERPVYENDAPPPQANSAPPAAESAAQPAESQQAEVAQADDAKVLYRVLVTYGSGLLIRTGAGADYETVDGIDYDETVDVLEEYGRWYKVRTSSGVEGWIKGQGNTQKL